MKQIIKTISNNIQPGTRGNEKTFPPPIIISFAEIQIHKNNTNFRCNYHAKNIENTRKLAKYVT